MAADKKADNVVVLDVADRIRVADYFVVVTGLNRPHVKAIADDIHYRLKALGETHRPTEDDQTRWWVLLDYGDVVVHVLQPEAREYYEIERLYGDCPKLDWESIPAVPDPRPAGETAGETAGEPGAETV
jgi:ribosome-associated protein